TAPWSPRVRPPYVPTPPPPALDAETELRRLLDNPWYAVYDTTEDARKRSRPPSVAIQMLPSRSSKIAATSSPERPSACVKRSVTPLCTCTRPRVDVPAHTPPSQIGRA